MALHRVVPSAPAPNGHGMHTAGAARVQINTAGEARVSIDTPGEARLGAWGLSSSRWRLGPMVGRSSAMERLFLQMRYLANHLRLALLEGEPGTGKQLAARTLHELSPHRGGPFLACDAAQLLSGPTPCSAYLAQAQGGTLYLSGIDRLNHEQQGRLLQMLGRLSQASARPLADPRPPSAFPPPLGGQPRALLVSSTRPLRSLVLYGKFRGDLHAQLSAVHMALPALRDRREDIPLLLEHLLKRLQLPEGRQLRGFAPDLVPALLARRWPGNVAELEAALAGAAQACGGEWLRARDLPAAPSPEKTPAAGTPTVWTARPGQSPRLQAPARPSGGAADLLRPPGAPVPVDGQGSSDADSGESRLDPNLDRAILRHIRRVLASVNGNKLRAARLLGISRSTLYRLLETAGGHGPGGADPNTDTGIAV